MATGLINIIPRSPNTIPHIAENATINENMWLAFSFFPSPSHIAISAPPPVPNINPTQPRIISTGIIRLTAANEVLPTKLETNKPSTTPYIDVNISITIDGYVNLMSFLYPK